jgi:hypothetical protein
MVDDVEQVTSVRVRDHLVHGERHVPIGSGTIGPTHIWPSGKLIDSATDFTTESETQGGTSPTPARCGSCATWVPLWRPAIAPLSVACACFFVRNRPAFGSGFANAPSHASIEEQSVGNPWARRRDENSVPECLMASEKDVHWSRVRGSNSPPHDYKSSALPTELTRRGPLRIARTERSAGGRDQTPTRWITDWRTALPGRSS